MPRALCFHDHEGFTTPWSMKVFVIMENPPQEGGMRKQVRCGHSRAGSDWGACATSPVYRGLCATSPIRRQASRAIHPLGAGAACSSNATKGAIGDRYAPSGARWKPRLLPNVGWPACANAPGLLHAAWQVYPLRREGSMDCGRGDRSAGRRDSRAAADRSASAEDPCRQAASCFCPDQPGLCRPGEGRGVPALPS